MKKKNVLMTAFAILGFASITIAQTVPFYVPTSGLVGWWPFTGNANDESGNGNNGTVNGATLTSDRNSNINSAYNFDGISNEIIIPHNASFNFQSSNKASFSYWINPDSILGGYATLILNKQTGVGCTQTGWNMYLYNTMGDKLQFRAGNGSCSNVVDIGSVTNIGSSIYTHVVNVLDNGFAYQYINGTLSSTLACPLAVIGDNTGSLIIAGLFPGASGCVNFNGKIDDIGIWNRVLTQQEITDLYNGCQLSVTTQPINQSVNISNNAQFTTASSDSLATYQWQTDLGVGFQNLNNVGQYSGTANDTLTITNTTLSNNNQPFRCIISSGSCTDTSAVAVLTVVNNVGINEIYQSSLFSVYPNPANSQINVKADAKLLGSIYTVYDNTGKVVLTGKIISENTTIELGNLSGGIYLFSVGENMKQTFKVIKE
jgi:Concanavalin A-like lectin/glucanases superfamily/Secretion system C-terminal sorting domain